MISGYADTGWLCSLYCPDSHTELAIQQAEKFEGILTITWLHHLELRNAFRLRVFRKEVTTEQRDASLRYFETDLANGLYRRLSPDQEDVGREAERLSALYSETIGTRSLDLLHIALAICTGTEQFFGFDKRQNQVAKACGLNP